MSANVRGIQGEYRRFTPSEVGFVIKQTRKGMGLKREVLAAIARVADKTIQRAEAGFPLSNKSSRRIATALGLRPDMFNMTRFIPHPATPEEVLRQQQRLNEAWSETHFAITVGEPREVRDVLPLFRTGAVWVDDSNVAEEHRQKFKTLEQVIAEGNDQAAEVVFAGIRETGARGYVVKGAVIQTYFSDRPFEVPRKRLSSYLVAFRKSLGVKDTTPVEGWFSKMRLLKMHGVADVNQFPGDESTVWTGRDPLGILCGDASADQ